MNRLAEKLGSLRGLCMVLCVVTICLCFAALVAFPIFNVYPDAAVWARVSETFGFTAGFLVGNYSRQSSTATTTEPPPGKRTTEP